MGPKPTQVDPIQQLETQLTDLSHRTNESIRSISDNIVELREAMVNTEKSLTAKFEKLELMFSHFVKEKLADIGVHEYDTPSPSVTPKPSEREAATVLQTPNSANPSTPMVQQRGSEVGILPLPLTPPVLRLESPQVNSNLENHHSISPNKGPRHEISVKKREIPLYEGQNPEDWLYRVEKCFDFNHTPEEEKLSEALPCLTGSAATWSRTAQDKRDWRSWLDFKERFKKRFRLSRGCNVLFQLVQLQQTGTLTEYLEKFEELSGEAPHIPEDLLVALFLAGLKQNLRERVLMCRPENMEDLIDVAKLAESIITERNQFMTRPYKIWENHNNNSVSRFTGALNKGVGEGGYIREWKPQNEVKRSVQNPCRYCGERFFAGHKCQTQQKLRMIEAAELGKKVTNAEEQFVEPDLQDEEEVVQEQVRLLSVFGIENERSMRLKGSVNGIEVIVVIDSGATCNFISMELQKKLDLHIDEEKEYRVSLATGRVENSSGMCRKLEVMIQGAVIVQDFLLFELGSTELILGYSWLASLGETKINWGLYHLSFLQGSKLVTLEGDPALQKREIVVNANNKWRQEEVNMYLLELTNLFDKAVMEKEQVQNGKSREIVAELLTLDLPNYYQSSISSDFGFKNKLEAMDKYSSLEYKNQMLPTEASLTGVKPLMQRIQGEVQHVVATRVVEGRYHRIREIRFNAEQSEAKVQENCHDNKKLNFAQKNITTTITAIHRLIMLVSTIKHLQVMTAKRQYMEAVVQLEVANPLCDRFEAYKVVPKVTELREKLNDIKQILKSHIISDFSCLHIVKETEETKLLQKLSDSCLVVEALESSVRDEMVNKLCCNSNLCCRKLTFYEQIFERIELTRLDKTEQRYAWIKYQIRTNEEIGAGENNSHNVSKICKKYENTWRSLSKLLERYPKDHLEDKVSSIGDGIDRIAGPITLMSMNERSKRREQKVKGG